jgi:hypothetical protein
LTRYILIALFLPAALLAQSTLTGKVTDASGALVASAKVTLTPARGSARTATSNSEGAYAFLSLAPGDYTVNATAPNLALPAPRKFTLAAGPQTVNLQLQIATKAQEVTVTENAGPSVSTEASSNANAVVIKGDDLDALGDSPEDLQADLQALAGPGAGPNGGSIFIDGFSGGELPPKSSIREIRINQNPFSPEYDKLGFGRIEIFTKPGTDKWRGSFNYNNQNELWNSRNPYAPFRPPLRLNEFEGGVSGRLTHRASMTLNWGLENVKNGSIVNAVTLNSALLIQPFSTVRVTPQNRIQITPRVDYQLSTNHTITLRYTINRTSITDAGIGSFDLVSRGYHLQTTSQTVQATETAVIGAAVNETRFQYYRAATDTLANSLTPAVLVLGAFNGGGSQSGLSYNIGNAVEVQNNTSILHGPHSIRFGVRFRARYLDSISPQNFGGTFTFAGIDIYQLTLQLQQQGDSASQIRALGGGASQFTLTSGNPALTLHQLDASFFAGDDWKLRPNVTLSVGLRYEAQTHLHDGSDFAPRVGIAWAPGPASKSKPKTVLRAGFGVFYDRFALNNVLAAQRYNGITQQQYVISNPDFFPTVPSVSALATGLTTQVVQALSPTLRSPYLMQSAATIERQLPANTTLAVTFTNTHGLHQLRSEDVNAPLPGTAVYPRGSPNPLFVMASDGLYNQNQLLFNVNTKVNSNLSLYGFYVLNRAHSNTDGLGTFPANAYNYSGEYGAASTDVHNRVNIGGSLNLKWHIRLNPYVNIQSGAPFDITAGHDIYGTTLFNGRPGIATDRTRPGLVATEYGLLDPNPIPGELVLPRNYGRGPGSIAVNVRLGKTWGFGGEKGKSAVDPVPAAPPAPRPGGGPGGGGPGGGGQGGGPPVPNNGGGISGGVSSTTHRYNLTLSFSVRNLANHTNPGPIIGNITSPLFGQANQAAGSGGGGGISESANNRRTEIQLRFAF